MLMIPVFRLQITIVEMFYKFVGYFVSDSILGYLDLERHVIVAGIQLLGRFLAEIAFAIDSFEVERRLILTLNASPVSSFVGFSMRDLSKKNSRIGDHHFFCRHP